MKENVLLIVILIIALVVFGIATNVITLKRSQESAPSQREVLLSKAIQDERVVSDIRLNAIHELRDKLELCQRASVK